MKKIVLVSGVLLIAVGGGWWWLRPSDSPAADEVKPVAAVQVIPVARESIARRVTAYGTVEAPLGSTVAVTLAYDCLVQSVTATSGARVTAGQELLRVEPTPDARLQLDSARGVAALAAHTLASARQRYDLRLATNDDLKTAEQAAADARLKVDSLEKRGLGESVRPIVAPVAGIVVKLDASPGTVTAAGTALAAIARSNQLQARLSVEASDAVLVKVGQEVTLSAVNRPAAPVATSVVSALSALVAAGTGTVEILVPLPVDGGWLPGERVAAEIVVERKMALVVPRSAVLPDDDQEILYTIAGGKAVKHIVQLGIAAGDQVEVSSPDLQEGAAAVVQGNYELADGMDVQVAVPAAKGASEDRAEAKP